MRTDTDALKAKAQTWTVDVYEVIQANLQQTKHFALPEFASLTELVLTSTRTKNLELSESLPWLALPLAISESLTSPSNAAIQIGAGIELARISAGILDQCIDQDTDGALWAKVGMSQAINIATGLTALALITVGQIQQHGVSPERASLIRTEFERTWFRMCEGQHQELSIAGHDDVPESVYWDIASTKSGAFFELACKAAALLSNDLCSDDCNRYATFGHNIGIMMQLMNDLEGLWELKGKKDIGQRITLPILFARSRLKGAERDLLNYLLQTSAADANAATAVQEIVERVGAVEYVFLQFQIYRQRAIQSLDRCGNTATLLKVLDGLFPPLFEESHASSS